RTGTGRMRWRGRPAASPRETGGTLETQALQTGESKIAQKINAARASHPGRIARGMFRAYSSLEAMRCVLLKPHSGECRFWAHSARCWLQIIHPEMVTCNSRPAVIDSSKRLGPAISGGPSEEAATPGHRNAQS